MSTPRFEVYPEMTDALTAAPPERKVAEYDDWLAPSSRGLDRSDTQDGE